MKILFFTNDLKFFNSHRLGLASYFVNNLDHEVFLVTSLNVNGSHQEIQKIKDKGINLEVINFSKNSLNPFLLIADILTFRKVFKSINPSIAFFISAKPNIVGGIATVLNFNVKKFFSISGLGYLFINSSLKNRILKSILFFLYKIIFNNNTVIFQNQFDFNLFKSLRLVDDNSAVIIEGNGIDLDTFSFIRREPPHNRFIFASRLLIDKGLIEFISAAKEISGNFEFIICGAFDESNPKNIDKELFFNLISDDPRIRYLGELDKDNLIKQFHASSFFVLPSYREGLPQVALEAAATGLPLVLSDVPGCNSILEEGFNGIRCSSRSKTSLREAMIKITQIKSYQGYSMNSYKMVAARFSSNKIYNEFKNIIE